MTDKTEEALPPLITEARLDELMGESISTSALARKIEAEVRAALAQRQQVPALPPHKVVDVGFRFDCEAQAHTPQVLVEFEPVPVGEPNSAKGWADRNAFVAALTAAPPAQQPYCQCPPKECHGKGTNECRWQIMGYAPALAEISAAWVPFSKRLEIAEKAGTVVDQQFNEIVRSVVEYIVPKVSPPQAAARPSLVTALHGLLDSLNREPTEFELRCAAHEFTVRADRRAARRQAGGDDA